MRRWLLRFLILIFLVASLLGCQKKFRIVPPSAQQSSYDKFANIIIDICDPAKHSDWLEPKSEPERFVRLSCAAGMEKMRRDLGKIRNDKLKSLIRQYQNSDKSGEINVQQKD